MKGRGMNDERREMLKGTLRWCLEQSLDQRVDRYLSVNHQWVTGGHHFAHASSECLDLYRDAYFLSCVMVAQAVSDGIAKFVAERNGVTRQEQESNQALVRRMQQQGIVSRPFADAFDRIQGSFRNDYHHMNPPVGGLDHESLAGRNIVDLAAIEREIFECSTGNGGTLVPKNHLYWDIDPDGTMLVYLRLP
jgi:hypothetical protein